MSAQPPAENERAPNPPQCYHLCGHDAPLEHIGIAAAGDPIAFSHAWHCPGCGRQTFTRVTAPAPCSKTPPPPPV